MRRVTPGATGDSIVGASRCGRRLECHLAAALVLCLASCWLNTQGDEPSCTGAVSAVAFEPDGTARSVADYTILGESTALEVYSGTVSAAAGLTPDERIEVSYPLGRHRCRRLPSAERFVSAPFAARRASRKCSAKLGAPIPFQGSIALSGHFNDDFTVLDSEAVYSYSGGRPVRALNLPGVPYRLVKRVGREEVVAVPASDTSVVAIRRIVDSDITAEVHLTSAAGLRAHDLGGVVSGGPPSSYVAERVGDIRIVRRLGRMPAEPTRIPSDARFVEGIEAPLLVSASGATVRFDEVRRTENDQDTVISRFVVLEGWELATIVAAAHMVETRRQENDGISRRQTNLLIELAPSMNTVLRHAPESTKAFLWVDVTNLERDLPSATVRQVLYVSGGGFGAEWFTLQGQAALLVVADGKLAVVSVADGLCWLDGLNDIQVSQAVGSPLGTVLLAGEQGGQSVTSQVTDVKYLGR